MRQQQRMITMKSFVTLPMLSEGARFYAEKNVRGYDYHRNCEGGSDIFCLRPRYLTIDLVQCSWAGMQQASGLQPLEAADPASAGSSLCFDSGNISGYLYFCSLSNFQTAAEAECRNCRSTEPAFGRTFRQYYKYSGG